MIVRQPDQKFPTAPEGAFRAVCVDEIDLGKMTSTFNGETRERHMVRLVWQIDEEMPALECENLKMPVGSLYIVKQDYTASLDEKATLRKHLQSWRGKTFTFDELVGFDLEQVIGVSCMLSIVHNTGRKGGVFANVQAVMKSPKGSPPLAPLGYVRVKDRKPEPAVQQHHRAAPIQKPVEEQPWDPSQVSDDDVPF